VLPVFRTRLRLIAWISLLSMLIAACAPTVSRTLANARSGGIQIEICMAAGSPAVAIPLGVTGTGKGEGRPEPRLLEDCPYCGVHVPDQAAPPPTTASHVMPLTGRFLPRLFDAAPRPLFAWSPSRPRGPPMRA
ncbi:MAG: DUF2946 domain-containing protein, partial [Proteobacteria bacterium]|nr:DUF2946 domain-containing protein [Pseudomonadota bacterium]